MALDQEKCAACEGVEDRLSGDDVQKLLQEIPGWEPIDNTIQRTFSVSNFVEAMKLADKIAPIAEQENHHPDLHISWGKVRVELSTHKVGGLSKNDFILAAKINRLWDITHEAASI